MRTCAIPLRTVELMQWPPRIGEPLPRAADAWCTQPKLDWILGEGHGSQWNRVFRVDPPDIDLVWASIAEAVPRGLVMEVRRQKQHTWIGCGVVIDLEINSRIAPVLTAWNYAQKGDAPRLVTAFPKLYNRRNGKRA